METEEMRRVKIGGKGRRKRRKCLREEAEETKAFKSKRR